MAKSKLNILFVKQYSANPKFILNDIHILKKYYNVFVEQVKTRSKLLLGFYLLKQFFSLLIRIYKTDLYYIWFADYHSFLPVLFAKVTGKKSIICAGGYEATYIPEINCGVFTNDSLLKRIRRFAVTFSLKNCSLILPVDESLIENENTYVNSNIHGAKHITDGIKNMIPEISTEMKTVYLGYDETAFRKPNEVQKENIILSAGLIPNDYEVKRKGFDILVEAAKIMTDVKFVLIGLYPEYIIKYSALNLPNLELLGVVSYDKLIEYYSKSKVFAQISIFEGMPSTICEAMLCECIPVGSNVNAIPKIIDDTGFIIYHRSIEETVNALKKAVNASIELGKSAREHIIKLFPYHKREGLLLNIVNKLFL